MFLRLCGLTTGLGPGAQISEWPACGGANGSIRFEPEINHGANAGLSKGEPPPPAHPHPTAPFLRARNYIYDCTDVINNARGSPPAPIAHTASPACAQR